MTLKEYERLNALALKQQEENMKKDQQSQIENAEELAARLKREQFKKYQKVTQKQEHSDRKKEDETVDTPSRAYTSVHEAYGAQPIGKWEAVEPKQEEEYVDLELPKQHNYFQPVATVQPDEPPVKKFKEKTITSIDSDEVPSTFKKRKFGNRNIRRANDDE